MPLDWTYLDRDRVLDASGGNYATTRGCWPKVLREMSSEYVVKDGEPYGNPALLHAAEVNDVTASSIEVYRKGYEAVGMRYQRAGLIRDLDVTAERGPEATSVGLRVRFWDIAAAYQFDRVVPPAWLS